MAIVVCRWCGKRRGVLYVDTPNRGPYGILFCPHCDFAHDHAAGPPCENRIRDVRGLEGDSADPGT